MTGTGTASYFKPPVLTTTQRDAIVSPANGMVIFNSTDTKLQKYEGTWRSDMAYGGTLTYLAVPSMAIGDIFYADTATSIARLGAGTSGNILQTKGVGAAPAWAITPPDWYVSGTAIVLANDTEGSNDWISLTKVRENRVQGGTFRVSFDLKSSIASTVIGTIYKNGVSLNIGTTFTGTTYQTFSTIIGGWAKGDLCQLYLMGTALGYVFYYRNFRNSGTAQDTFRVTI